MESEIGGVGGGARPSITDIWLYKLEDAVTTLVLNWAGRTSTEEGYDHFRLYAHGFCLKTAEDVQRAPDSILFEAMGLDPTEAVGWLQFMVRDMGWHSMLAANWGHPVLVIPDGVTYDTTTEDQRRAQVVAYFLDLMRDRGSDPLGELCAMVEMGRDNYRAEHGRDLTEDEVKAWLRENDLWAYYLYHFAGKPNPPSSLSRPKKPEYSGEHAAQFARQIGDAAGRRRAVWDAAWSCDCARLKAEQDERQEREDEAAGIAHVLGMEGTLKRGEDIGVAPDGEELSRLASHFQTWMDSEPHIRNTYLHDRLAIFLARNDRARELLRLPDNRELAAQVKREVRWLYLPGWTFKEGGGVCHMAQG